MEKIEIKEEDLKQVLFFEGQLEIQKQKVFDANVEIENCIAYARSINTQKQAFFKGLKEKYNVPVDEFSLNLEEKTILYKK